MLLICLGQRYALHAGKTNCGKKTITIIPKSEFFACGKCGFEITWIAIENLVEHMRKKFLGRKSC
jgi:hypothetical protein